MKFTKEDLAIWLKAELKDIIADRKHIDESDMPFFNKGLDWVCALDTKVEKILAKLATPDLYEELLEADGVICELCKRLNPQHENCTSCQDRDNRLKALAKVEGK